MPSPERKRYAARSKLGGILAREQRRLAAILAADVVGYSRLMGRDERGTLEQLKAHRDQRLMPALARNFGRLVKTTGDGALAEFASAVDALAAAIEFQQSMKLATEGEAEDRRIVFRIGLHLGDLLVDGDDLYGDSVNVAARLEAAAPPGGILVSAALHDAVRGRLKAELVPVGDLELKNIDRRVRAFRVEWNVSDWPIPTSSAAAAPYEAMAKPSIAVLPFANKSDDEGQEYFADGVSEDIITALSRFRELTVISRGSSFVFKNTGMDVRQIAAQLGVRYVLSGSLRKAGSRIRVSAELTDASTGTQIWSERYDRELTDVFELQDDVSRTVAAVIEPAIRGVEIERARRKSPVSLNGYDLYLQALPHLWAATREDIPKAVELLRRSLALDDKRAPALAALARALVLAPIAGVATTPELLAEAVDLARRAVEADPGDSFAQAIHGFALFGPMHDHTQGIIHAREAVRLNPNSAFAWGNLGYMNSLGGAFEEGIDQLNRAMKLSPFDSLLFFWMQGLAAACFGLARYDEGVEWARKSVQQNPGAGTAHRLLAANLAASGHVDEARAVTSRRDAVQKTSIRDLRAMRLFKQEAELERYLAIQRLVGVPEG